MQRVTETRLPRSRPPFPGHLVRTQEGWTDETVYCLMYYSQGTHQCVRSSRQHIVL